MNRKLEPVSLGRGIVITASLGLMRVVAGCLDRKAGRLPAEQHPQGVSKTGAAKARIRLSVEAPPVNEPYPCLHGGEFKGPAVPESPDPLVGYRWREPSADDGLQSYVLRPVAVSAVPARSFEDPTAATTGQGAVLVKGTGSLRFDFGVESAPKTQDARAPAPDAAHGSLRTAAALFTGDPSPCQQSIVLDVALKAPREFQFALYFVDFDRRGRRVAVELFDLDSRKLIAPVKVFPDLNGGAYAVYACRQPVRIRVNQIRGDNAALSGLFFDP